MLNRIQTGAAPSENLGLFILFIIVAVCFWSGVLLAFSPAALRAQLQIERLNALKAE